LDDRHEPAKRIQRHQHRPPTSTHPGTDAQDRSPVTELATISLPRHYEPTTESCSGKPLRDAHLTPAFHPGAWSQARPPPRPGEPLPRHGDDRQRGRPQAQRSAARRPARARSHLGELVTPEYVWLPVQSG
jgi:hypothetical protein